jgi:hypothetical protein
MTPFLGHLRLESEREFPMQRLLRHKVRIRRTIVYGIALFALLSIGWRTVEPKTDPILTLSTPDAVMLLECDRVEQAGSVKDCRYGQFGAYVLSNDVEVYAYWMEAVHPSTGEPLATAWMIYVADGEVVKVE